jgi:DNA replication protein DnaC
VLYYRVPRLLDALALARGDGRYVRLLKSLARVELLILDDWGLAPLTSQSRAATCSKSSTIATAAARRL